MSNKLKDALEQHKRALPALALELPKPVFDHYKNIAVVIDYAARKAVAPITDEEIVAHRRALASMDTREALEAFMLERFGT